MSENARKSQKKYWILFTVLLLLAVALILPPLINMNRYQRRIADAIGSALGRRVHLSSATLRLLPLPGLELSDFLVEEDPAFGAEPTLRAQSVEASIRLSSLWRGHLEIGRISLDQPSVNLVRNSEGRWNIGTVLLQASHIPNAPTSQRHAGGQTRFPYIEATNARVNFKFGAEKKPFSLFNADFAMWLANPDEWRLRLEAQPVRTDIDLGLSDTGTVRVEGSLHRAQDIGDMPIDLQTQWTNAPLGQIARLLIGEDTGWRGNLEISGTVKGNIFNPQFKNHIQIAGMHRQEFSPLDPFNVDATCQGSYRHDSHSLEGLACLWPIQNGQLLLTGSVPDTEHPRPDLNLQVQNVPATFALSALRLVRNGFANGMQVSGTIQGTLAYKTTHLAADMAVSGFALRTSGMDKPLQLPLLHIGTPAAVPPARHPSKIKPLSVASSSSSLHLDKADIALGGDAPLTLSGDFTRQGFSLHLNGDAAIAQLKPLANTFSLFHNAAITVASQGEVSLALSVHGPWLPQTDVLGSNAPGTITEGTLALRNASYQASFLPEPVQIVSAQAVLSPEQLTWNPVSVIFHKIPATLSVTSPRPCSNPSCIRQFSLTTPQLDASTLQSILMGAGEHGEFLQQILARLDRTKPQWPALKGTVHTGTFALGSLALHDASAEMEIAGREVHFTSIDGRVLNGTLHATGAMNAAGSTPHYSFDAQILHAGAAGLASLWHEPLSTGIVSGETHLELTGYSASDLAASAQGSFHWDWTQGAWPNTAPALTHFDHWNVEGTIKNSQLVIGTSQVTRGQSKQNVSGTISFTGKANLTTAEQEQTASR